MSTIEKIRERLTRKGYKETLPNVWEKKIGRDVYQVFLGDPKVSTLTRCENLREGWSKSDFSSREEYLATLN